MELRNDAHGSISRFLFPPNGPLVLWLSGINTWQTGLSGKSNAPEDCDGDEAQFEKQLKQLWHR